MTNAPEIMAHWFVIPGFAIHLGFVIRASSFLVASRNNLSKVVADFRRSISFAFDRLMSDSISSTSWAEASAITSSV
jgi:hypothetical protein